MGHGVTAGTANQAKSPDWLGLRRKREQEAEDESPWTQVQKAMSQSGASMKLPDNVIPIRIPHGAIEGMGPYVPGGTPATSTSTWSGGPLGAVPNHHGWARLVPYAKDWTLRLLGAFPDLTFSSGYRDPARNKAVGGVANSGHMRGVKVDISGPLRRLQEAEAWAKRYGARTLIHNPGPHLDISWEPIGRS